VAAPLGWVDWVVVDPDVGGVVATVVPVAGVEWDDL
jgi:hypothetical protein